MITQVDQQHSYVIWGGAWAVFYQVAVATWYEIWEAREGGICSWCGMGKGEHMDR